MPSTGRRSWIVLAGSALPLLFTACSTGTTLARPVAETELGAVRGVERNGAVEFRGIPFAAPPVGELRWALPRPAAPWAGVRDATDFGNACPQTRRYDLTERSTTEDCLTLNVSTPPGAAPGAKLPVLVWIHGGAFVGGSGSLYRLDKLATQGRMVVVSANYRVGVFGFLAIPGLDAAFNGGQGLEDQRHALRWVQRNIAAFGGDPENVTVAGESAGGGSVCQHLVSPDRVQGLFHKAIVQSAGCLQPMPTLAASLDDTRPERPPMWKQVAAEVGCGAAVDVVACLRAASVDDLLAAQDELSTGLMALGPIVENGTVPAQASDAVRRGEVMRVPLLMGGTRDELRLYVAYAKLFAPFLSDYGEAGLRRDWLPTYYGPEKADPSHPGRTTWESILEEYRVREGMDGARLGSMLSDHQEAVGINDCLYLRTSDAFHPWAPAIHQWEFADPDALVLGVGIAKGMDPGFALGAVHSSELNYLFPNLSNTAAIDAPDLPPTSQAMADQLVAYWGSFVATGAPAPAGPPPWPRYELGGTKVMRFTPGDIAPYDAHAAHRCAFWKGLFP